MILVGTLILLHLIRLHTPEGQDIDVNADSIVTLRDPRIKGEHFPKGTKCVLNMVDGKFNLVIEDCQDIRRQIEEAQK